MKDKCEILQKSLMAIFLLVCFKIKTWLPLWSGDWENTYHTQT